MLNLHTDASFTAMAGFMGKSWFSIPVPASRHGYGITFLELYPIVVAVYVFGHRLANKRVVMHTDNAACVYIINKQTSQSPRIMRLVRQLVLQALHYNVKFSSVHMPGDCNEIADYLSRFQVTPHQLEEWGLERRPVSIPSKLLPRNWQGE